VVLSHNGFRFFKRGGPPLNLKIFISSNAFDNSSFFYEQPEFTWLVRIVIAVKAGGEIGGRPRLLMFYAAPHFVAPTLCSLNRDSPLKAYV
jgi:hypothetical protein